MKRIIALLIVTVLCLGMLASCDIVDQFKDMIGLGQPDVQGPSVSEAIDMLDEIMKTKKETTMSDFDVVAQVKISGVTFPIEWTTNSDKVSFKESTKAGYRTVDLPDTNTEEFTYTITATITVDGASESKTYTFKMPAVDNSGITSTPVEGVAYKLFLLQGGFDQRFYALSTTQDNQNKFINTTLDPKEAPDFFVEKVDGGYKWYTMVNEVKTYVYAKVERTESENGTVKYSKYIGFNTEEGSVFTYDENKGGVWTVKVLDLVWGVGTYGTYKTISISEDSYFTPDKIGSSQYVVQFMTSEYANTLNPDELPEAESDAKKILDQLYGLADNESVSGNFTLTGTITALDSYNNPTIVVEGYEDMPVYCYRLTDDSFVVGATITVSALQMKNYGGKYEFMDCTLEDIKLPGDSGDDTPVDPPVTGGNEIVFDFGANGTAGTHADGTDIGTGKSYTSGNYTLTITDALKVYDGGFDKAGNSILKFGTSSVAGTITFVVPDEVTSVVIYAARYKNYNDNNIIVVNGTEYTLNTNSDDGQYEAITVDTTTNKTVTVASSTSAGKPRCVVNSIVWVAGEGSQNPVDPQPPVECEHNYDDGVCTKCGEEDPNYVPPTVDPTVPVYNVVTSLNNGDKVVIGAPAYNKLLSMLKTGNYNVGVDYTTTDFSNVTNDEIFVVTVNDDGTYTFTSLSNKVLAMQDNYTSLNDAGANNKWEVTAKSGAAAGIFLVKNTVRGTYLEWYNQYSNWSTYSNASDSQFEISFYLVEAGQGGSETPVECEHNYDNGVCTKCGEEDPNYVAPSDPIVSGSSADFDTIVTSNANGDSGYTKTYTTTNGWVTANSAIQTGKAGDLNAVSNPQFPVIGPDNTHKAVCMNGKTSAPGSITSPTLNGGVSKITINFTKMFTDTELSFTVTVTDVATGTEYTKVMSRSLESGEKYVVYTEEWVLDTALTGDFTIELVNNCPTGQDSNKDRVTILDIIWA